MILKEFNDMFSQYVEPLLILTISKILSNSVLVQRILIVFNYNNDNV